MGNQLKNPLQQRHSFIKIQNKANTAEQPHTVHFQTDIIPQNEKQELLQLDHILQKCKGHKDLSPNETKQIFESLVIHMKEYVKFKTKYITEMTKQMEYEKSIVDSQLVKIKKQILNVRRSINNIKIQQPNQKPNIQHPQSHPQQKTERLSYPTLASTAKKQADKQIPKIDDKVKQMKEKLNNQCEKSMTIPIPVLVQGSKIENKIVEKKIQKKIVAAEWADSCSHEYKKLIFEGDKIRNNKITETHIFGKPNISVKNKFTVTFTKFQTAEVGIIDQSYKLYLKSLYNESNKIFYTNDSDFSIGQSRLFNQGIGFRTGETVTVHADMQAGLIEWIVGGQVRYKVRIDGLAESDRVRIRGVGSWVPYVCLMGLGDQVHINQ